MSHPLDPAPPSRRLVLGALAALPFVGVTPAFAEEALGDRVAGALAALERDNGGRLGVSILDTATDARFGHREGERFAMCSTFKTVLAALVLARVDRGEERLHRALPVAKEDLVIHAPVTTPRVGTTMTLAELCHAAVTTSDNTATNLLLAALGGPAAVTAFARSLGDEVTRLDRIEPDMNHVDLADGDARDTTTPAAMAALVRAILVGGALRPASVEVLTGWLRATATGGTRLRAGLPAAWRPGDKTGTGPEGRTNDVAVAWPPGRGPIVVAAYYEGPGREMARNEAVLAEVGRIAAGV